jgi:excisionase family DNA binding protein
VSTRVPLRSSPRLLTPRQAWTTLGVSKGTFYALLRDGAIASLRIGKARRVPVSEIERFIEARLLEDSKAQS